MKFKCFVMANVHIEDISQSVYDVFIPYAVNDNFGDFCMIAGVDFIDILSRYLESETTDKTRESLVEISQHFQIIDSSSADVYLYPRDN